MSYPATGWREAGACATVDPDLFFPIAAGAAAARHVEQACRVCTTCPVRPECLEFAMEHREMDGIWGGTTAEERIRARRKEADARRYAARMARARDRAAAQTAA